MSSTIVIDGIIGCGKSSLISQLSDEFTCFQEPIGDWSLLQSFYNDMRTYSAPFQFQVLFSYHKLYSSFKNINDKIIIERCPYTSKHVFTEMLYNKGTMNKDEYDLYNNFYSKLSFPIDLFVYLKVDPELAYKRILNRDRAAERSLQYEYLVELHDSYEREMNTLLAEHPDKLVVVDANTNLSIVKKNVVKILRNF